MANNEELSAFRGPHVAVDVAVLTVVPEEVSATGRAQLAVLVAERDSSPAGPVLPGRFLRQGQTVAQAVADALRVKAGLADVQVPPRLLRVFDDPARDARGWTLSLGHAVSVPFDRMDGASGALVHVDARGVAQTGAALLFDHDVIVREAAQDIRARYELAPDPDALLEEDFTLAELRHLHEGVLGQPLRKDTFNRRMVDLLKPQRGPDGSPTLRARGGRPAQVYRRATAQKVPPTASRRLVLPRDTP